MIGQQIDITGIINLAASRSITAYQTVRPGFILQQAVSGRNISGTQAVFPVFGRGFVIIFQLKQIVGGYFAVCGQKICCISRVGIVGRLRITGCRPFDISQQTPKHGVGNVKVMPFGKSEELRSIE